MPATIKPERLWDDIMALAALTEPDRPYTRRSFSPLFIEGRRYLAQRFADAGLAVHTDAAGNLIGRREGSGSSRCLMVGSHSDTVPSGGRFDGIAGVVTALEIARALDESGIKLQHALEVVDFLAEEPSEYGVSCIGSRGLTGRLEPAMLDAKDASSETVAAAIRRVGGNPNQLGGALRDDIAAYLELHIEQGRVLEEEHLDIGLVSAILGLCRFMVRFEGSADHAGTTPFALRRDALLPACATVLAVRAIAEDIGRRNAAFVATVGIMDVSPRGANVVPGRVELVIDVRSPEPALTDDFSARLQKAGAEAAAQFHATLAHFAVTSSNAAAVCDPRLVAILKDSAASIGVTTRSLASGAGHDGAFVARLAPMAMVFVPSRAGRSHCADEWTDQAQIAAGAATLLEAVQRADRLDLS